MTCFTYYFLWLFSATKSEDKRVEQVLARGGGWGGSGVVQIMYTQVNKCKNNKIIKKRRLSFTYLHLNLIDLAFSCKGK
jgi:hypothetical protein